MDADTPSETTTQSQTISQNAEHLSDHSIEIDFSCLSEEEKRVCGDCNYTINTISRDLFDQVLIFSCLEIPHIYQYFFVILPEW